MAFRYTELASSEGKRSVSLEGVSPSVSRSCACVRQVPNGCYEGEFVPTISSEENAHGCHWHPKPQPASRRPDVGRAPPSGRSAILHVPMATCLERDHLVRWVAAERAVQIREAADRDTLDHARYRAVARLAGGESPLDRALVAHHQQDALLLGDLRQPLSDWIARPQDIGVVVEKEHPDNVDAVPVLFELRQDHLAELVARIVSARNERIRDLHACVPSSAVHERAGSI